MRTIQCSEVKASSSVDSSMFFTPTSLFRARSNLWLITSFIRIRIIWC